MLLKRKYLYIILILIMSGIRCEDKQQIEDDLFPAELVKFTPYEGNPVFTPGCSDCWDKNIRERGWILYEDGMYHMWYTGYECPDKKFQKCRRKLGYASSPDGINWTRYGSNPIYDAVNSWMEDQTVVKHHNTYYMAVEDEYSGDEEDNHSDLYTSTDRIKWDSHGKIKILEPDGAISKLKAGSPVLFYDEGQWYLFYEDDDRGVWLATTADPFGEWKNVSREAVLEPTDLGNFGAMNSDRVIGYSGKYYVYGTVGKYPLDAPHPNKWAVYVAVSDDLIHWTPYHNNPITPWGRSSGMPVVVRGGKVILYCMHPEPFLYLPSEGSIR